MPVKVSFKLGNHSGIRKGSADEGNNRFIESLGEEVTEKAVQNSYVDVAALQRRLDKSIGRELDRAMNFAILNMVGIKSSANFTGGAAAPTRIYFETVGDAEGSIPQPRVNQDFIRRNQKKLRGVEKVEWSALKTDTIYKKFYGQRMGKGSRNSTRTPKMSREAARQHFVETGALRNDLRGLASAIVSKTGTAQISFMKEGGKRFNVVKNAQTRGKIKIGRLRVTFLPKLRLRNLPGIRSGQIKDFDPTLAFEQSLGITGDTLAKLKGPEVQGHHYHRPLLQPVFTYWALYKIPNAVAGAVARSIRGR